MAKISLRNIGKSFGSLDVLKGISLDIDDGTFVAFVGPSGCGKSTLLRVIAGLEVANAGTIVFDDKEMNDVPAPERGTAMVFQSYALYPHMTVWENMSFSLRLKGVKASERRRAAAEVAALLQLEPYLDRKPAALSGGQRQRVAIGRALLRKPQVFLFDEPLSNLDAALRADMRVELVSLHRKTSTTMIYVTHDQIEAMTMADRIVVLNKGEIVQVGAPMELYDNPVNRFVAEFIGAPKINLFTGFVVDAGGRKILQFPSGASIDLPPLGVSEGARVTIGIRPEHVEVRGDDAAMGGDIPCEVELVEHLGADALIHVRSSLPGRLLVRVPGHMPIRPDHSLTVRFPPAALLYFDEAGDRIPAG